MTRGPRYFSAASSTGAVSVSENFSTGFTCHNLPAAQMLQHPVPIPMHWPGSYYVPWSYMLRFQELWFTTELVFMLLLLLWFLYKGLFGFIEMNQFFKSLSRNWIGRKKPNQSKTNLFPFSCLIVHIINSWNWIQNVVWILSFWITSTLYRHKQNSHTQFYITNSILVILTAQSFIWRSGSKT
jgi:hypothetical protein